MSVLRAIVDSGIRYRFNVQARYEVGFDDEMLDLLRQAGFFELDLGIEFLDDASFATYHKKSTRQEIIDAIRNIRAHGLSVRGCSSWAPTTRRRAWATSWPTSSSRTTSRAP